MNGDHRKAHFTQRGKPAGEQPAANGDHPMTAIVERLAKAQVQLVNALGEQLLGGIGQGLCQPAGLAGGQGDGEGTAAFGRQNQADRSGLRRGDLGQRHLARRSFGRQPDDRQARRQLRGAIGRQEQAIHGHGSPSTDDGGRRGGWPRLRQSTRTLPSCSRCNRLTSARRRSPRCTSEVAWKN